MAATTIALASAGTAISAPVRDSSTLASRTAFGSSLVHLAPGKPALSQVNRVVAVRASQEDQQTSGKKVLASFLAAGAALSIAGQALAGNPIDVFKSKADEVVTSAQNATASIPKLPNVELPNGGVLQDAQNAAGDFFKGGKTQVDGWLAPGKAYPQRRVASTNGGTGSAIGDAKKRISNFGKNPFAENLTKTTEEYEASIGQATGENSGSARAGRELLGQDSTRVDEATQRVKNLGDSFKSKAGDAVDEAKNFVGSAQIATPNLPNLPTPSVPELPNLPNPLEGLNKNLQGKGDVASKVANVKDDVSSKASSILNNKAGGALEEAKGFVASAQDATSNLPTPSVPELPSLPNLFAGLDKNVQSLQGKAANVKDEVASKADDVKGYVGSKSGLEDKADGAVDGAKNLVASAQDSASKIPSLPNPFGGLNQSVQDAKDNVADVKDNVASKVDDVKGDISSKASSSLGQNAGEAANDAKNAVASAAQDATSSFPSLPNPFEGLNKNVKEKSADVKNELASKADDVKNDLSAKASSTTGDAVNEAKSFVGSAAQDTASNFPNLSNPFGAFNKNIEESKEKAADVKDDLASKAEDVKGSVSTQASKLFQ